MARYILIDKDSGDIAYDTANGSDVAAPIDACRQFDGGRTYEEVQRLADTDDGYLVYRADEEGAPAIPPVTDGTDAATIKAVKKAGRLVARIRIA
jgi:hypothetical protein